MRGGWGLGGAAGLWLFVGCTQASLHPVELLPSPPATDSTDSASSASAQASAGVSSPPAPSDPAPGPEASAEPPGPAPPLPSPRLEIEAPYLAGAYPYPGDAARRKALLVELERWNTGGLGEKWHPAPRVVIEEPVAQKGRVDTKSLMRHLRAEHYWSVRKCYDPYVKEHPDSGGRVVMSLTIASSGKVQQASVKRGGKGVPDKRKHKASLDSASVGRCIAMNLQGAHLPGPRKGNVVVSFSIDVYPGDAPIPDRDTSPSPGRIDLPAVAQAVQPHAAALSGCFSAAGKQNDGLWGRLALRLEVGPDGAVRKAGEVDSTFPSPDATRCASDTLRALRLPPPTPSGEEALVVVAMRWKPPE